MSIATTSTAKSSAIWFADGDVILRTDDSLFRVHGNTLRKQSSVLEEMLQAADKDGSVYEDCPVIRLHDTGDDMRAFLSAVYTPSYRPKGRSDAEVKDLIAILRLSTKYSALLLREQVVSVLSRQFPPTLRRWDSRTYNVHFERNAYAIANVIRESNLYRLLPTVLLHCCLRLTANMLLGFGPMDAAQDLDAVNKRAVLFAQPYLSHQILQDVFPNFYDFDLEVYGCHDALRCCRSKGKLVSWMKASPFMWCYATSTMETFLKKFEFCQTCSRMYMKCYAEGRQKIWDDLPQQFSLPPWDAANEGDRYHSS
ncbi:hypothetical protein NM688_g2323 [Phlebia brevispora]|uniref:Uncharacterized protein n=1 Tax=Phlebia brevispora TaxID=194682 RepID=A0ACC1T913_9APHY|nr:hypothetical protein NM688_g2323 [Phlebia brevispora]